LYVNDYIQLSHVPFSMRFAHAMNIFAGDANRLPLINYSRNLYEL